MKLVLSIFMFLLLFYGSVFGQGSSKADFVDYSVDLEPSFGLSSPNKGLLGVRLYTLPKWSFGVLWGTMPFYEYKDFGISGSYHFWGRSGPYIFSSHHLLFSKQGSIWEICTGGGYQHRMLRNILIYGEVGVPFYIGGGKVWRHYEGGIAYNRVSHGDVVLFDIKTGIGVGYLFTLW